jgi:hypothetical protein
MLKKVVLEIKPREELVKLKKNDIILDKEN